jgi:soluble lytic murein transglycosylase
MSTHAGQRRRHGSGSRARGRRRLLAVLLLGGLGIVLGAALLPTVKHAAREFTLPLRHEDIIRQQARDKDLPPDLIAAVIYAESKFSDRTSNAGARGLMQITPRTAEAIAAKTGGSAFTQDDLGDPDVNIRYGSWYLRNLMDSYGDNVTLALAAYNAGQSNVDRWIVQAQGDGRAFGLADIPFAETRDYVRKVLATRGRYRAAYARELGL